METSPPLIDAKTLRRKLSHVADLHETGIELALVGLRLDHPQASPQELQRLLREKIARFRQNKWGREPE
jgi:hypothetical protein